MIVFSKAYIPRTTHFSSKLCFISGRQIQVNFFDLHHLIAVMSTTHILPLPKAVFGLRIAQLVVAVVILGLSAYGVTFYAFDGASLSLFTVCFPFL